MNTAEGREFYVDRSVYLFGEINSESALDIITSIKAINKYDEMVEEMQLEKINELVSSGVVDASHIKGTTVREPILLEINSGGGHSSAGFSIISAIENSETPIIGYVTGDCMSMATAVLASCHYRLSSEYARFMIHDVYSVSEGKYNELVTTLSYIQHVRGNYKDVLTKYTEIEDEELDSIVNANSDHHFSPEQAKSISLIDAIDTDKVDEEFVMERLYGLTSKPEEVTDVQKIEDVNPELTETNKKLEESKEDLSKYIKELSSIPENSEPKGERPLSVGEKLKRLLGR